MAQDLEPTFQDAADVTARQALQQARDANIATRRRWPAVRSAAAAVAALRESCDPPTVILQTARRSA